MVVHPQRVPGPRSLCLSRIRDVITVHDAIEITPLIHADRCYCTTAHSYQCFCCCCCCCHLLLLLPPAAATCCCHLLLPQGVEWAPQVFRAAEAHGLVLLEEEGVWDTEKRGLPPPESTQVQPMSDDAVASFDVYDSAQLEARVFRATAAAAGLHAAHPLQGGFYGPLEAGVAIGLSEGAALPGGDGFELLRLVSKPQQQHGEDGGRGGRRPCARAEKEVLICHAGEWLVSWWEEEEEEEEGRGGSSGGASGSFTLECGDVFSIPSGLFCGIEVTGGASGMLFCVTAADEPQVVRWRQHVD